MFCPYCGKQQPEVRTGKFCVCCGEELNFPLSGSLEDPFATPTHSQENFKNEPTALPIDAQAPVERALTPTQTTPPDFVTQPKFGMRWFKFLIYFSLWISGVFNILMGISYLSGSIYETLEGVSSLSVYTYFPDLNGIDVLFGFACVALGVFAIIVRFRLAKFKTNAPKLLHIYYIATIVASFLYAAAVSNILGVDLFETFTSSDFLRQIISIIVLCCNVKYFNRRKELFVN